MEILKRALLTVFFILSFVGLSFAGNPFQYPLFQGIDADGNPISGGLVYTYEPGTTTPKIAYTDSSLTVPATNPIVLDSKGEATFYLSGLYKIDMKTATGVQVGGFPIDNVYINTGSESKSLDRDYGCDITSAIAAIGAIDQTELKVDCDCVIADGSTVTVTDNIATNIINGGSFDGMSGGATDTITFNGDLIVGDYTVFGGNIVVTGLKEANVHWWGPTLDGVTDNSAKVQLAVNSIDADTNSGSGGWVTIPNDCYYSLKEQSHILATPDSVNYYTYRCLVDHTSGTFATDLAAGKWEQTGDYAVTAGSGGIPWVTGTAYTIVNPSGVVLKNNVFIKDNSSIWYPTIIMNGNSNDGVGAGGAVNALTVKSGYGDIVLLDVDTRLPIEGLSTTQARGGRVGFGLRVDGENQWQIVNDVQNNGDNNLVFNALSGYKQTLLLGSNGNIRYGDSVLLPAATTLTSPPYQHTMMGNLAIQDDEGSNCVLIFRIADADDVTTQFKSINVNNITGDISIANSVGTDVFSVTEKGAIKGIPTSNGSSGIFNLLYNAGTTTIANTSVTANSLIFLQAKSSDSATAVSSATGVYISSINPGVSFTITHPNPPGNAALMSYFLIN